jgi:hypothetical protein
MKTLMFQAYWVVILCSIAYNVTKTIILSIDSRKLRETYKHKTRELDGALMSLRAVALKVDYPHMPMVLCGCQYLECGKCLGTGVVYPLEMYTLGTTRDTRGTVGWERNVNFYKWADESLGAFLED